MERVRDTEFDKSIYSYDYRDITALREITNTHKLTLLLIHHTRKLSDNDPLNTLPGSMGLVGSADGVFVLEKDSRTGHDAKLTIANRDTEGFCFRLRFNPEHCKWGFVGNYNEAVAEQPDEKDEWLCLLVDDFLADAWSGTATELCAALKAIDPDADVTNLTITKQLKNVAATLKDDYSIVVIFERKRDERTISLTRKSENNAGDSVTA